MSKEFGSYQTYHYDKDQHKYIEGLLVVTFSEKRAKDLVIPIYHGKIKVVKVERKCPI